MNIKTLSAIILLVCLSISFNSCDDEIQPLSMYQDYQEVRINTYNYLSIKSGNGDYTVRAENPEMLDVEVSAGVYGINDRISVHPKQKGKTKLYITDNVSKETCEVEIKVIDSYVSLYAFKNDHPVFSTIPFTFLINNDEKEVYFFDGITHENTHLVAKGKYRFSVEEGERYLTLTYTSDEEGKLTDAAIPPTDHTFRIVKFHENEDTALYYLNYFLDLDWNIKSPYTTRAGDIVQTSFSIKLEEIGTDYIIHIAVETIGILPEGVLE